MNLLAKFNDQIYALLRIVAGFMFSFHGVQKIFGILSDRPTVGFQMWSGGLIELICGLLILVGFQTRWAAFIASGEMAVAYFQFHWHFQFGKEFFPAINGGELAALYSFVFLFIASRGGVMWCLDSREQPGQSRLKSLWKRFSSKVTR
jgi:putative oxidoreductase